MVNWKNKAVAYLHDPPSKALNPDAKVGRYDASFPTC